MHPKDIAVLRGFKAKRGIAMPGTNDHPHQLPLAAFPGFPFGLRGLAFTAGFLGLTVFFGFLVVFGFEPPFTDAAAVDLTDLIHTEPCPVSHPHGSRNTETLRQTRRHTARHRARRLCAHHIIVQYQVLLRHVGIGSQQGIKEWPGHSCWPGCHFFKGL